MFNFGHVDSQPLVRRVCVFESRWIVRWWKLEIWPLVFFKHERIPSPFLEMDSLI